MHQVCQPRIKDKNRTKRTIQTALCVIWRAGVLKTGMDGSFLRPPKPGKTRSRWFPGKKRRTSFRCGRASMTCEYRTHGLRRPNTRPHHLSKRCHNDEWACPAEKHRAPCLRPGWSRQTRMPGQSQNKRSCVHNTHIFWRINRFQRESKRPWASSPCPRLILC
jgi:hypothetical protein